MKVEYDDLKRTDKVASIFGTIISAGCAVIGTFVKPELFSWFIIVAVAIFAGTITFLIIKLRRHSKKIQDLEIRSSEQETKIQEHERKIAFLERLAKIPYFQNKWHLYYTFIWRNSIDLLHNNISLSTIHIKRALSGKGKLKDNNVTYTFTGKALGTLNTFSFCLAGLSNVPLNSINLAVKELRNNESLDYKLMPNTIDNDIKLIEIYFKTRKDTGDLFSLEISWKWPKTAYTDSDYFSFPNIYSNITDKITIELIPAPDMAIKYVETYKFAMDDSEPTLIDHIYDNGNGVYISEIINPVQNADYITYYE